MDVRCLVKPKKNRSRLVFFRKKPNLKKNRIGPAGYTGSATVRRRRRNSGEAGQWRRRAPARRLGFATRGEGGEVAPARRLGRGARRGRRRRRAVVVQWRGSGAAPARCGGGEERGERERGAIYGGGRPRKAWRRGKGRRARPGLGGGGDGVLAWESFPSLGMTRRWAGPRPGLGAGPAQSEGRVSIFFNV